MGKPIQRNGAFSLMEAVVLLVVLALVIGGVAPLAMRFAVERKASATREVMEALHRGIVGDPDSGHFGFLGDVGRLPASLEELVEPGGLPLYHVNNTYGVGMGWNGPYVQMTAAEARRDAFGREYGYGRRRPGQIQSAGPDGEFDTEDDLLYPPVERSYFGMVRIEIPETDARTVRLHYADNGVERYLEADTPPYIFEDIHLGPHAVQVFREDEQGEAQLVHQTLINLTSGAGVFLLNY